jgi:hypothetical protein
LSNKNIAQMASTRVYTIPATMNDNLITVPLCNHSRAQTVPVLAGLSTFFGAVAGSRRAVKFVKLGRSVGQSAPGG